MIITYLETSHKPNPYEIHSQFLFPMFVTDILKLEKPLIINLENNEQGIGLDSN